MIDLKRIWHTIVGDQKYLDAANHYRHGIVAMLQEEARLDQLQEGPFKEDVSKYQGMNPQFAVMLMMDHGNSIDTVKAREQKERRELAYGCRTLLYLEGLSFNDITLEDLREGLEEIIGQKPDLGGYAVNTMLYVAPTPDLLPLEGYKRGCCIAISGRTNSRRESRARDIAKKLVSDNVSYQFKDKDGRVHETCPYLRNGFRGSYMMFAKIAEILRKEEIDMPERG